MNEVRGVAKGQLTLYHESQDGENDILQKQG